ncbi:DUF1499 domain-containing protein [Aurantimonas sp. A2-1-M11]|uniref:DUF1499 domain-containing protein n=1 Tax=Aurantimonas sp. A2-1-M11 TaxID=3113712 RepID=UPI002F9529C6
MNSIYGRLPVSGHYLRKRLRFPGLARAIAAFAIVLMVAAVAIYRLGAIVPQALIGLLLLVAGLAGLALLISCYGLLRVWFSGVTGGGKVFAGFVLSLLALAPFGLGAYLASVNPQANAAYTDGFAAGAGATAPAVAMPERPVSTLVAPTQMPSVVPGRRYLAEAPRVFQAVRTVLADHGWTVGEVVVGDPALVGVEPEPVSDDLGVSTGIIAIPTPRAGIDAVVAADDGLGRPESDQYRVAAVARDMLFALPSDVTIRLIQEGAETFVDLRAMSRATGLDLGQNRRFIEAFLLDLDLAMSGLETLDAPG